MSVIRLDKIAGQHIESVINQDEAMVNGSVVQLGNLVEGETELYEVKVATTEGELAQEFLLVASPEVDVDPRKAGLKHFTNKTGVASRAYHIVKGDVITLTEDAIDGTPVLYGLVIPQVDSVKLIAGVTAVGGLTFKVIQVTTLGYDGTTAYVLRAI